MITNALKDEPSEEDRPENKRKTGKVDRDRSTIQFPYLPLGEAVAIAKGIHSLNGSSCQIDQLAAHLKQKPDTGSFRLKLGVAKQFGLTTHSLGTITLTDLGKDVCDPQKDQAAKADAFLKIPLYYKVYEQFKGGVLPPAPGLETAMVEMGVAPKQGGTARQVFHRSASEAGFFWSGESRLVRPPIKGNVGQVGTSDPNAGKTDADRDVAKTERNGSDGGGGGLHPLIEGLIRTLPMADKQWPADKRVKWLRAAAQNFDIIYPDNDDTSSIEIRIQKGEAQR